MEQKINKQSKKPFFTVFIGLYNSEEVIHRFFKSALQQTFRDFELIIIDDASKDDTVKLTKDFIDTVKDIDITFEVNNANKGVGFGRRRALELANGEVFVKWDHDDIQDKDQLLEFYKAYTKFEKKNVAAVWCLCKDMKGNIVGNRFPKDNMLGSYFSMYSKYILSTHKKPRERHNCINTEIHKQIYDFMYSNRIIPKGYRIGATGLWAGLAMMGYNTVYIDKPLRQYFIEDDRPRMSNSGRTSNADQIFIDRVAWINHYMKFLPASDVYWRIRLFMSLNQYGLLSKKNLDTILKFIKSPFHKFLTSLFYVPIYIVLKMKSCI